MKEIEDHLKKVCSFFCNLFSWTKLYIAIDPMSLCDFIDSLGSH